MALDRLDPLWYVLHTKSRFENVVNDKLLKKSIEVFLPKIRVRSKRKDRKLMIKVPLFPGYVFVKTSLEPRAHLDILKTVGAVKLVGSTIGPVPVPEESIKSLQIMVSTDEALITGSRFKKGDRIMVIRGPFAGVTGYFSRYQGTGRVIVNIDALGQFAGVNVGEEDIELLPKI